MSNLKTAYWKTFNILGRAWYSVALCAFFFSKFKFMHHPIFLKIDGHHIGVMK